MRTPDRAIAGLPISARGAASGPLTCLSLAMIRASRLFFSRQYPEEHIENVIWNIKPEIGRNILKDSGTTGFRDAENSSDSPEKFWSKMSIFSRSNSRKK
jgi:hypothetical protein